MRRVTSLLPSWDNYPKVDTKKVFDRPWAWTEPKSPSNTGQFLSKLSVSELQLLTESTLTTIDNFPKKNELEDLWPSDLHKECEKAARILRSFCKDGFYPDTDRASDSPTDVPKALTVIPKRIIQKAVGLAIFTAARADLWISGAGGSGALIARTEDGEWSSPAGILLQTSKLSFAGGVEVYDCVIVINDRKSLETFSNLRTTLGNDIKASIGPVSEMDLLESAAIPEEPIPQAFTYLKSRGFQASISMNGTTIIGRIEENKRLYGRRTGIIDILTGKVLLSSIEVSLLCETAKAAEGSDNLDQQILEKFAEQASPGDVFTLPLQTSTFGIPEVEDPDPFGVVALEKAGLEIRESGTRSRPSSTQFEYHPSPTSPIFARFNRASIDAITIASNRGSYISTRTRTSIDRSLHTVDMATQTDEISTPSTSPSYSISNRTIRDEPAQNFTSNIYSKSDLTSPTHLKYRRYSNRSSKSHDGRPRAESVGLNSSPREFRAAGDSSAEIFDMEEEGEEPVFFEATSVQATVLRSTKKVGAGLVDIPKRAPPPPVPARSASRGTIDASILESLREKVENVELRKLTRISRDKKSLSSPRSIIPFSNAPLPDLQESMNERSFSTQLPISPSRV